MRCAQCGNKLLQKSGSSTRLRIKGIVEFDDATGLCKSRCHWCNASVEIPLELKKAADETEQFTIPATPRPPPIIFRKPPSKPAA